MEAEQRRSLQLQVIEHIQACLVQIQLHGNDESEAYLRQHGWTCLQVSLSLGNVRLMCHSVIFSFFVGPFAVCGVRGVDLK